MSKFPVIIGRTELMDFPDLLLTHVPVKIDTGAYTSSIHAKNIKLKTKGNKKILTFDLLEGHYTTVYPRSVETAEYYTDTIRNSFGKSEERYIVNFKIKLGTKTFRTEFSLADRSVNNYPILVGRKTLNRRFLVDSSKSHIDRKELKKKFNIDLQDEEDEASK